MFKHINWRKRMKNGMFVVSLGTTLISATYQVLAALGYVPAVTQDMVTQVFMALVTVLAALGIITDPTTPGVTDGGEVNE